MALLDLWGKKKNLATGWASFRDEARGWQRKLIFWELGWRSTGGSMF